MFKFFIIRPKKQGTAAFCPITQPFFVPFFLSSPSETHLTCIWVRLIVSHQSWKLSSLFFILFFSVSLTPSFTFFHFFVSFYCILDKRLRNIFLPTKSFFIYVYCVIQHTHGVHYTINLSLISREPRLIVRMSGYLPSYVSVSFRVSHAGSNNHAFWSRVLERMLFFISTWRHGLVVCICNHNYF